MNPQVKKMIVLSTGGTGGHVFPAKALLEILEGKKLPTLLIVEPRSLPYLQDLPPEKYLSLPLRPRTKNPLSLLRLLWAIFYQALQLFSRLNRKNTAVVVAFGGYSCLPAAFCAILRRIPLVLHEQNAIAGRAQRLLSPFAKKIAVSFPNTKGFPPKKTTITGLPLRQIFTHSQSENTYSSPKKTDPLRILIMGGSASARLFSTVVPAALVDLTPEEKKRLHLTQQTHQADLSSLRILYEKQGITATLSPFFENPAALLARSHLLICRGGAATLFEALNFHCPMLIVPYPFAMDNHQTENARAIEHMGKGFCLPQNPQENPDTHLIETLRHHIKTFLTNPQQLTSLSQKKVHTTTPLSSEQLFALLRPFITP